jgi:hypothetical protein
MLEVKNICANNLFGMKFFEIYLIDKDGYRKSINVSLSKLKELNITKAMNGFKKVRTWAESEEGQKFLLSQEDALASIYDSWGIKK